MAGRRDAAFISDEEPPLHAVRADCGVYIHSDGTRFTGRQLNLRAKQRRIAPIDLDDPYGTWAPGESVLKGGPDIPDVYVGDDEEEVFSPGDAAKRKRYISSVCPHCTQWT